MLTINHTLIYFLLAGLVYAIVQTVRLKRKNNGAFISYLFMFAGLLMSIVFYLIYLIYSGQVVPVQ